MFENDSPACTRTFYGPCALIFASTPTGSWRIVRPAVDRDNCIGCGVCARYCPAGVMTARKQPAAPKKKPGGVVEIDFTYCKGCGICADVCSRQAITMIDERGV